MHTFVIPAYGESPFLEICIQSLMAQTVKSKVIMVTSTPSGYSEELAKKYGIDYHVHHEKGIANDWNFGLSKVETGLATIAHQDDIYEPEYAHEMIKAFSQQGKDVLIAFTDYADLVNGEKSPSNLNSKVKKALLWPFVLKSTINNNFFKKLILTVGDPVCCPSVSFNLRLIPGFSFSTEYSCILDWYAWYQLAAKEGAFCFINKQLVLHRIHGESETTNQLSQGIRGEEETKMLKMIWGNTLGAFWSRLYASGHKHNNVPLN